MNTKKATASPRDPGAATNIAGKLNKVLAVVLSLGVGFEHGVFTGLAACFGLWLVSDGWVRGARSEDIQRSFLDHTQAAAVEDDAN